METVHFRPSMKRVRGHKYEAQAGNLDPHDRPHMLHWCFSIHTHAGPQCIAVFRDQLAEEKEVMLGP